MTPPFSVHEFTEAISRCSNSSAPGPDHLSWHSLKALINNERCLRHIIHLANACIDKSFWPIHFKASKTIVIPKPQKAAYDTPKSFRPIVLLNTLGKLIEKVISNRFQFHSVRNGFLHPNQLGGVQQRSTSDAGVFLMHLVRAGWIKGLQTSVLAFDIAQFFPSLNHEVMTEYIAKAGFDPRIQKFIHNYLNNWSTQYYWNNLSSLPFECSVGVGQGSALSPILSALYLSPFLKIFQKRIKNLKEKIPTNILSFVDDGLLISQEKSFNLSSAYLTCSYNIISNVFKAAGLVIEQSKSEVFHFTCSHKYNSSPLDLSSVGGPLLTPKPIWRYLGFFFDRKLSFHHHCRYYATKSLSTIKSMKLLGSSTRSLSPLHKRLLYHTCVLPIALYRFQLWFFKNAPTKYHIHELGKLQRRAALWITGAFRTSPSWGVEGIAGLIPIHLHLRKLVGRSYLRYSGIPSNHAISSLLEYGHS